jgi:ribosome recycling factor
LTGERRKDLVKQVGKMGEGAKISIRNVRRDFKSLIESDDFTEDEQHRGVKQLQDLTDQYIKQIDGFAVAKEAEIMNQ